MKKATEMTSEYLDRTADARTLAREEDPDGTG